MRSIPVIILTLLDSDLEDQERIRQRVENASGLDFVIPEGHETPFVHDDKDDVVWAIARLNGVPLDSARNILRRACRGRIKQTIGSIDQEGLQALTEFKPGWERGADPG